jgi:hypothetical protein
MMAISNYKNSWQDDMIGLVDPWLNSTITSGVSQGSIAATNANTVISNRLSAQALANMNLEEMHHLMKGEMISSAAMYGSLQREELIERMTEKGFKDHVKRELCSFLVNEMMKNNLIEFTMATDPGHIDYIYRARAYVMPDSMTKILREYVQRNT